MAKMTRIAPVSTGGGIAVRDEMREALYSQITPIVQSVVGGAPARVKPFVEGKTRRGNYGLLAQAPNGDRYLVTAVKLNADKFDAANYVPDGV